MSELKYHKQEGRVAKKTNFFTSEEVFKNNAKALLQECVINGKAGKDPLYAWFLGEKDLIDQTAKEE